MTEYKVYLERTLTIENRPPIVKKRSITVRAADEAAARKEALDLGCSSQVKLFGDTGMAEGHYEVRAVGVIPKFYEDLQDIVGHFREGIRSANEICQIIIGEVTPGNVEELLSKIPTDVQCCLCDFVFSFRPEEYKCCGRDYSQEALEKARLDFIANVALISDGLYSSSADKTSYLAGRSVPRNKSVPPKLEICSEVNDQIWFEKLIRAKVRLEDAIKDLRHSSTCVVENDPEGYAPCNCGTSKTRAILQRVLDEMK